MDQKSTIQHLIIVSAASPSMAFARWDVHADVVATKLTKIRVPVHVELHCQTWRSLEIRSPWGPGPNHRINGQAAVAKAISIARNIIALDLHWRPSMTILATPTNHQVWSNLRRLP